MGVEVRRSRLSEPLQASRIDAMALQMCDCGCAKADLVMISDGAPIGMVTLTPELANAISEQLALWAAKHRTTKATG